MNVPTHADIDCVDGFCGYSTHLVLDPENKEITHLVVKDGLLGEERLVPIDMVFESSPTAMSLCCTKSELKQMPPFVRNEPIQPIQASDSYIDGDSLLISNTLLQQHPIIVKREQIPEGEIALKQSVSVDALDGHIGHVSEFLVYPADHTITHLVAEEGHFWDKKHITIPASEIDHMDKDCI